MALKILVVDPDPTVQRALGNALAQASYEAIVSGDGLEAMRLVHSDKPALVLVAASVPSLDGVALVARLRDEEGMTNHTPVIVLLTDKESDARSKAQRAGADDFLIKPFHPAELLARMRSLLSRYPVAGQPAPASRALVPAAQARAGGPARVVLFYGAKGGVGTTTLAINTAIALHREMDRRVCLVDANLQFGDHRVFLDLPLDRMSIVDLATAPVRDVDLIRQILVRHDSGIDLLLAPPSPEMAELVSSDHIPEIVGMLSADYDYIIIDIDKRLDEINLRLMDLANAIYVVMMADLPCLKNVRLVLETIGHLGYSKDKVKLVMNRSNAFTGINVKNAESALKRHIDFQILNEYRSAVGALNSGAPIMATKPDSVLGKSLLDFVKGVEKDLDERMAVARAGS